MTDSYQSGPLAGQGEVVFTSADLAAYTARLIGEMEQRGTKIRRDEWQFGDTARIRINYAHREQRIHLMTHRGGHWPLVEVVCVNLDATDVQFPTLTQLLERCQPQPAPESVIHREV